MLKERMGIMSKNNQTLGRMLKTNHGFKSQLKMKIVKTIVEKLKTVLSTPEEVIFSQNDISSDMYFIAKGECAVNIIDEKRRLIKDFKILRIGDYFGEIALLYGCQRSATVISKKYSTLAMLSKANFKEIQTEYPEIVHCLKEGIYKYNDRVKKFLTNTI